MEPAVKSKTESILEQRRALTAQDDSLYLELANIAFMETPE
jgi:hypothetical protein